MLSDQHLLVQREASLDQVHIEGVRSHPDDPEHDDLTSVTPSEAEGTLLQFSPPLE